MNRTAAATLRIGGLTPLTTIDFPGRLAAVLFLQGCPWRCSYCQNPDLLPADAPAALSWDEVLSFLHRRRGLLDGVVFSGGEPTLQSGLAAALAELRSLGFAVGLHSAGMYPERLAEVLPLLDWIGLDIKAPWDRYEAVNGAPGSGVKVLSSLAALLQSGLDHECRTTWHPSLYPFEALRALAQDLAQRGVANWSVQLARIEGQAPARIAPAEQQALAAGFRSFCLR